MATVSLVRLYRCSFEASPYATLAVTGACLSSLADAAAQLAEQNVTAHTRECSSNQHYDFVRTIRFSVFGLTMSPILGRWNSSLEQWFPLPLSRDHKASLRPLLKRVACDQLLAAPAGLAVFFGSMGFMEGHSLGQIEGKYVDLFKPTLFANWKVWPLAQFINFRFIPLPYRVPFQSSCGILWTAYLSLTNARNDRARDAEESAL